MLARRQASARLLVLGTYRPEEVLGKEHPLATLTQELHIHGHSQELPLTLLTKTAVGVYLTARLPGAAITDELVQCIHQRTEGNPLFMVNVVDYVTAQDVAGAPVESRPPPARLVEAARVMPESLHRCLNDGSTDYTSRHRGCSRSAAWRGTSLPPPRWQRVWRRTSSRSKQGVRDWPGVDNGYSRVGKVSGQTGQYQRATASSTRSIIRPSTTVYQRLGVCAYIGGLGRDWRRLWRAGVGPCSRTGRAL